MLQKAPIQSNQTKVTRGTRKNRQNDSNGQRSLQKRTEQFLWSVGTRRNFKVAFYSTYPSILSDILQLSEKAKRMEKNPDIMKPRCNEHDCQSRGLSLCKCRHTLFLSSILYYDHFSWKGCVIGAKRLFSRITQRRRKGLAEIDKTIPMVSGLCKKKANSSSCGRLASKETSKWHFISTLFIGWFYLHCLHQKTKTVQK